MRREPLRLHPGRNLGGINLQFQTYLSLGIYFDVSRWIYS